MAKVVNTHEAKSRLSELIRSVEQGEEVIVARNGVPVVKLVPVEARERRMRGAFTGQIVYGDDVVGSDAEIASDFDRSANQPLAQ